MATKAPIADSLLQFTKCPICLEEVDKLKVLPCQHTTCLPCLKQLIVKTNHLRCPLCTKEHAVPNGGCDQLPDCLMAKQIADLIKEQKEIEKGEDVPPAEAKPVNNSEAIAVNNLPPKEDGEQSVSTELAQEAKNDAGDEACEIEGTEARDSDMAIRDKRSNDVKRMALSKELERAVEEGQQRYTKAQQQISDLKAKKEKSAADAEAMSEAIEEYRQSVEYKSQKKKQDVSESQAAHSAEIDESIGSVEPNADKIKASIESAPGLIARLSNGSCKPEDITSAQQLLDEIRGLETNLDLPSVGEDTETGKIRPGDSVCLNYDKDTPVDEILNEEVSMASIGILVAVKVKGLTLSKSSRCPCVTFPEKHDWEGKDMASIKKAHSKAKIPDTGDRVRIKTSVDDPHFAWKGVRAGESRGVLKDIDLRADAPDGDVVVVVDFPEVRGWKGLYSEIELLPGCGFEVGDDVKIKTDINEPRRGWAGVTKTSIGKITKVEGSPGNEEITVNFVECENWIGLPSELEVPRKLMKDDKVKVKPSVKTPEQGWRGISHRDVGVLKMVLENSASDQIAQVKFPGRNELWSCRIEELELLEKDDDNDDDEDDGDRLRQAIRAHHRLQRGLTGGLGGGLAGALLGQHGMGIQIGLDEDGIREALARRLGAT